jgi:outer membrane lipopolysaccharide assembly protein LptE/RlpB
MLRKAQFSRLILLGLISLVVGCGWQLKGYHSHEDTVSDIALDLESINNPMFEAVLKKTLTTELGINLSNYAPIKLSVERLAHTKRTTSKNRSGEATGHQSTFIVDIQISLPNKPQTTEKTLSVNTYQSYNANKILPSDSLDRAVKNAAYQELARKISHSISTQLKQ